MKMPDIFDNDVYVCLLKPFYDAKIKQASGMILTYSELIAYDDFPLLFITIFFGKVYVRIL